MSNQKPYHDEERVVAYRAFKDQVYDAMSVLHPCSSFDASPSKVFDNVTYVDLKQDAMDAFKKTGLKAFGQDIKDYKPTEEHDLLILFNPVVSTKFTTQHLKKQGYVLSNDWTRDARWMFHRPDRFSLWGTIDFEGKEKNDDSVVVSRDLTDLFVKIDTVEGFREIKSDFDYNLLLRRIEHEGHRRSTEFSVDGPIEEVYRKYCQAVDDPLTYKQVPEWYVFVKR